MKSPPGDRSRKMCSAITPCSLMQSLASSIRFGTCLAHSKNLFIIPGFRRTLMHSDCGILVFSSFLHSVHVKDMRFHFFQRIILGLHNIFGDYASSKRAKADHFRPRIGHPMPGEDCSMNCENRCPVPPNLLFCCPLGENPLWGITLQKYCQVEL